MLYTGVTKCVEAPATWYDYVPRFVGALIPSLLGLVNIDCFGQYAFLWSCTEINGEILTQTLCGKRIAINLCEPIEVRYVAVLKRADHLRRFPGPFSPRYERAIGRLSWVAQISQPGKAVRLYPPAIQRSPVHSELPAVIDEIFESYKKQGYMIS